MHNRLLSAAWFARHHSCDPEQLEHQLKLTEAEALFVYTFVYESNYSHDEFLKVLKHFGIKDAVDPSS